MIFVILDNKFLRNLVSNGILKDINIKFSNVRNIKNKWIDLFIYLYVNLFFNVKDFMMK